MHSYGIQPASHAALQSQLDSIFGPAPQCAPGESAVMTSDGAGGTKWICEKPSRKRSDLEQNVGYILYSLGFRSYKQAALAAAVVGVAGWLVYSRLGGRT